MPDDGKQLARPQSAQEQRLVVIGVGAWLGGWETLEQLLKGPPPSEGREAGGVQPSSTGLSMIAGSNPGDTLGPLRVVEAADGMTLEPGAAYVAPAGGSVGIEGGRLRVNLASEDASLDGASDARREQLECELEAARQELQRLAGELEAADGALRASQEKLRASDEQLQRTRETLTSCQQELAAARCASDEARSDLACLLQCTGMATVFLDQNLRIRSFTPPVADIYPLEAAHIGELLSQLAPLADAMPPLPALSSLDASTPAIDAVKTWSGKSYARRVHPNRTASGELRGAVITFSDVTDLSASEHLQERQQRQLRAVTDAMPALIAYIDSDERYQFVNHAYGVQFRRSLESIHGLSVRDLLGPNYVTVQHSLKAALGGQKQHYEVEVELPGQQERRWMQATYIPDVDDGGNVRGCYVLGVDITDRKSWEQALQTQESHLRRVIDHMMAFVGVLDTEGTVSEVNRAALQWLGLHRDDIVGEKFWDCDWWNDGDATVARLKKFFADAISGKTVRYDVFVRVADDRRAVVDFMMKAIRDESGAITHVVFSGVDITDRKWAEQRLADRAKVAGLHAALAMALSQSSSREDVLQACCDTLVTGLGLVTAVIWLHDDANRRLRVAASSGDESLLDQMQSHVTGVDRAVSDEHLVVKKTDGAELKEWPSIQRLGERTLVGFPLLVEDHLIGIVALCSEDAFTEDTLDGIRPMTDAIAQCMRRKEVEAEVAANERRLRVAMESGHIGTWEWNFETDQVLFDRSQYEVLGWPADSGAHSRQFFAAIHPDDLDAVRSAIERSIHHGEDYEHVFRFIRPDGQVRWLAGRGNVILDEAERPARMIGVNWDITNRKTAEQRIRESEHRLRESEKRYRLALAAANLGTWRTDRELGVTERDSCFNRMLGLADESSTVAMDDLYERLHTEDRERIQSAIERSFAAGVPYDLTYRIRQADGTVRWIRDMAQPLATPEGQCIHWIGATADVTDQKEFEQSLEASRRVAEAANRSRGEFLANMSHEIRTPMTAILGYADLLSGHLQDPDNLQCIETIRRNGKYLLDIINDILDLSKIDAGKIEIEHERVRPDALIGDIRSLMDVRAKEKQVPLEIKFDGKIPAVIETDAVRLRQILLNLIGNAIKFTDEGSVQLVIRYLAESQMMQFDIIDTGIGISDKDLETLFEPFIQADTSVTRAHGGTGLGLTISRRLARILGGDIAVKSKINEGSIFSVTIRCTSPAQVELIEPNLNSELPPDQAHFSTTIEGCVLVVDDRRDIRFLAQHFVEKAGGSVILATNGLEAINIISDPVHGAEIDVVLMDMQMPVMDGYDAASRLREKGFDRPIIALTAHAMKSDRDKCLEAGCTDYTTKPLHGPNLVRMIADHIESSRRSR